MVKLNKKFDDRASRKELSKLVSNVRSLNENKNYEDIKLVDEKILTIYLNSQEILTAMTIGDYPEYLAAGFLYNQNIIHSLEEIEEIDFNEELSAVVVRTKEDTLYELKNVNNFLSKIS